MPPTNVNGKICYIEIPASDVEQSSEFYRNFFGWKIRKLYDGHTAFDDTTGEVSGAWETGRKPHADPGMVVYVMVEDIGSTVDAIEAGGGKIVRHVGADAPEITARFSDPAGNVFGLYQEPESFVIERTFDAPVDRVWKSITDKNEMKHWYFDLKEFKAAVGFRFDFHAAGSEGEDYHHMCRITSVVPSRKLAYTWRYDGFGGLSLVTFELFPEGNKTRLKLTHSGLGSFPPVKAFAKSNFEQGWTVIVGKNLKEYVEEHDEDYGQRKN